MELAHTFSPGGACNSPQDGGTYHGAYVLGGWNGFDPMLAPGRVPACFSRVHVFEPNPEDYRRWPGSAQGGVFSEAELRLISYPGPAGLGSEVVKLNMSYGGTSFSADIVRGDSVVHEHVMILSIDVHGAELAALQGLDGTFRKHGIDVVIVELVAYLATPKEGIAVLELLARQGYVLFDFIGVRQCSKHKRMVKPCSPEAARRALWKTSGPDAMTAEWYATEGRGAALPPPAWFKWFRHVVGHDVQTDILAVHESYLKASQLHQLRDVAISRQTGRGARPQLQNGNATFWLHQFASPHCAQL